MVPAPPNRDQTPFPTEGLFPERTTVPSQTVWSDPAAEGVGVSLDIVTTSQAEHPPFVAVHLNIFEPDARFLTTVL